MLLGDFYDAFPLGNGRWGIVVGDVCGHGVEAAKLTSLVRYSLRSAAVHHPDPSAALAEVDAVISRDATDPGRFATACYFQLELGDPVRLSYGRAGHPHPIHHVDTGGLASSTTRPAIRSASCSTAPSPPARATSRPARPS
jgi:sigma-B regulation protein RsbU (phosphoserine phosphatase)